MTAYKRVILVLMLVAFSGQAMGRAKVGDKARDFGLRSIFHSQKEYWVGDMIGPGATNKHKVLLLAFAASYCKPCWKELPKVIRVKKQYAAQGLEVLYVIADMTKTGWAKAKKKLANAKGVFPCAHLYIDTMGNAYLGKTWRLPALFVIDSRRRIAGIFHELDHSGLKRLNTLIRKLLVGGK